MLKYYPLIDINYRFDAVILGCGDYPSNSLPLYILNNANFLCCCDGAGISSIQKGLKPDAIVGDGDSLTEDFKKKYKDIIRIIPEQESKDQTKATIFCMEKGFKNIAYIGATGKREDHTIGNIGLLTEYKKEYKIEGAILTDYGYFVSAKGNSKFETFKKQQISFFNIDCSRLDSKGARWNTYAFNNWWGGTLNEALGNEIEIESDGNFLIFRTYEAKI